MRHVGEGTAADRPTAERMLRDTAFDVLALDSVTAIADPANPASARVLDKLGMQLAGRRIAYGRPHLLYRVARPADT